MPQTDARRKASKKYHQEKVEEIKFRVPKGHKAVVQAHAAEQGESVNAFLNRAVSETMERDNNNKTETTPDE